MNVTEYVNYGGRRKLYTFADSIDDDVKEVNEKVCEGLNCNSLATDQIKLKVEGHGTIDVFVCMKCLDNFREDNN